MTATNRMDISAVRDTASNFDDIAQTVRTVGKILEAACHTLKATAFIGNVGGAAVAAYLERILPVIENIGDIMGEQSDFMRQKATAWEQAQQDAGQLF